MADTTYLKKIVEPYVREQLEKEFGIGFKSMILTLTTGGTHEFDAVSDDLEIVGAIKTAGGRTVSQKNPSGKIKDAEAELYYLTIVQARIHLLILTSPEFYGILQNKLKGRLAHGLTLKLIQLPIEIQQEVVKIQQTASAEVSKALKR